MALTYLPDRRTAGFPDPAEVVTITVGGRTFEAGRRTAAHLQVIFAAFEVEFPDLELAVGQACYHAGYAPSAGTHDGDGVPDFYVLRDGSVLDSTEADYWAVLRFLRRLGWAAFFRCTGTWAKRTAWHIHAASLGCPGPVGIYVPGQVADYEATPPRDGLAGHAPDPTWHPDDIKATYFDYPAWLEANDMTPEESDRLERIERKVDTLAAKEKERADAELKRDRASWRREVKTIRDLTLNGATLEEIEAQLEADRK